MSFETLFIFFIVGVMLLTQILKQMAKKTGKTDKKPASGWRKGLEDLLEEFKREMEGQKGQTDTAEAPTRQRNWWEDLMPEESPAKQAETEQLSLESNGEAASGPAAAVKTEKKAPKSAFRTWEPRSFAREAPPESIKKIPHPGKKRNRLSRRDLRQAVIWSEILSPPLGLRGPKH